MVGRRDCEKSANTHSASDTSSDSAEEDLDYLIDDLLEKLSVCPSLSQRMTIKNKNRKDRSKHDRPDRSANTEVAGSSRDDPLSYPYQWVQYNSTDDRTQSLVRSRSRSSRVPPVSVARATDQFPYPQYLMTDTTHGQPALKRHLPRHHETSKKPCDIRGPEPGDDSDTGAGNNSEDEYSHIPENVAPNTSKVGL